jgi:hypothetical protein
MKARNESQTIKARQKQFLGSNYDIQLGEDKNIGNYQVMKLEAVADALYYLAAKYVEFATDNLGKADAVASGALSSSIVALPMEILGNVYSVSIKLDDYYKFVDKGVKGWADEKGGNSPYQFKNYGRSGKKNSKMVTAIRKWLISQSLQAKAVKNTISSRETKQKSITDTSTQTAIIISRSIKKKGLRPTHFWSDAEKSVMQIAEAELGIALKIDIINSITNIK